MSRCRRRWKALGIPGTPTERAIPCFRGSPPRFSDANEPSFFETGKKLNVILAICGTALVGVFFSRRMGPLAAFNCTALASLAALLPISTFFGAEAIFLVLFLFVCACGMRLLNENPVRLYLLLGLLSRGGVAGEILDNAFPGTVCNPELGRWLMNQFFGAESALAPPCAGLEREAIRCRARRSCHGLLCAHRSPARSRPQDVGQRVLQPSQFLVLGGRLGNLREEVRRLQEGSPG